MKTATINGRIFEEYGLKEIRAYLQSYIGLQTDEDTRLYIEYKNGSVWDSLDNSVYDFSLANIKKVIESNPATFVYYGTTIEEYDAGDFRPV